MSSEIHRFLNHKLITLEKKTIKDLGRDTLQQYRARRKLPLVVVLDNVRSLSNIGAIFRTSDAFLVERIMLCGISATPPNDEIHKTALGAELSVEWSYFPSTMEAIDHLKADGYTICSLEQVKGSTELQKFIPSPLEKYAIVAGHEVHGVDPDVVNASQICLEIPQFGTKHSLNVSVSTGIALWHIFSHLT